jgi:hypothetical protein
MAEYDIRKCTNYWYQDIGANTIGVNSKSKAPLEPWKGWQDKSIPIGLHENRINSGVYDSGIAVITGELWRGNNKGKFLTCIDLDNKKAIEEFLTNTCNLFHADSLAQLSKITVVEQHSDAKYRAHIYLVTELKIQKRGGILSSSDSNIAKEDIPAIEVKSDSSTLAIVSPSIHKNGFRYEITGIEEPLVLSTVQSKKLETTLEEIYEKYHPNTTTRKQGLKNKLSNELISLAKSLAFDKDHLNYKINEGSRNAALFHLGIFVLNYHRNSKSKEELEEFFDRANREICAPPLSDKEIQTLWNQIITYTERCTRNDENQSEKAEKNRLLEIAEEKIELLFRDQYNEAFANIFVKDHCETISIRSNRFKSFLQMVYLEDTNKIAGTESITNVVNILQAKAVFGDNQFSLSIRVAEYNSDFYYDLTNEKHQIVKINNEGNWQVIDRTPIPLFRWYNQIPQCLPHNEPIEVCDRHSNALETFLSKLTTIQDEDTKLLIKTIIVSYFIPNIPHVMLITFGGKGSAKSTFQLMVKQIVDPAKPSLFTIHDSKPEFIQQLAHNYLAAYDNMKYNPKWLSDEACKAITGIGQTKRLLYTDDDDKIYEYKHCLMFNGINILFSEPDVIDRSVIIELPEIKEEKRKTEGEILQEFNDLKPKILSYIFKILAKAMIARKDICIHRLPRMADFAIWGEAISQAMGYHNGELLKAYYDNIRIQNAEVIDSNSVAIALRKFIEDRSSLIPTSSNNYLLYQGTPSELLEELNHLASELKLNTLSREWPKDPKWLVRRINTLKSNLQQVLKASIKVDRNSRSNTSIIRIERNDSGNSGENKITPVNDKLSPYIDKLSPETNNRSLNKEEKLSIEKDNSGDNGDNGDNGDKSQSFVLDTNQDSSDKNKVLDQSDSPIGYRNSFYYYKQHPPLKNVHYKEIVDHIRRSDLHKTSNE